MVMMDLYQNDDDREATQQAWFEIPEPVEEPAVQKDAGIPGASPAPVGHTDEAAPSQGMPASDPPVVVPKRLLQGVPASSPSSHVEAEDSDEDDDIWANARGRDKQKKLRAVGRQRQRQSR